MNATVPVALPYTPAKRARRARRMLSDCCQTRLVLPQGAFGPLVFTDSEWGWYSINPCLIGTRGLGS